MRVMKSRIVSSSAMDEFFAYLWAIGRVRLSVLAKVWQYATPSALVVAVGILLSKRLKKQT